LNSTETVAQRNCVYGDLAAERAAFAETRDATHREGERYVWGHPEGIPATGKQTKEIIWTLIGFCLLLLGLAYLVWAGSHGGFRWQ
jgi:LPXTG-motif cell wall-anchored protein